MTQGGERQVTETDEMVLSETTFLRRGLRARSSMTVTTIVIVITITIVVTVILLNAINNTNSNSKNSLEECSVPGDSVIGMPFTSHLAFQRLHRITTT